MYQYKARFLALEYHDGDTIHVEVDYGFDQSGKYILRLTGIDAPERNTPEGKEAITFLENWMVEHAGLNGEIIIKTTKDSKEKYGRYLAAVFSWNDYPKSLNQDLVDAGHAKPYDGGAR